MPPDPGAASSSQADARELGFWTCTALVVGNTIGVGIFVMPAALAPYGLNALTGWAITIVGAVFLSIVFAGMSRAFPDDDGPYAYTRRAFGDGTAFVILWCYWVSTWVTNAAIAIGIVGYISIFVPVLNDNHWLPPLAALSLVWLFVLINLRGLRVVGGTQVITTLLKLLPQAGIIVLGAWQLIAHPAAYLEHLPPNPMSLKETLNASTIALFAMLGIECAMVPAGKVKDPARTIPRATLTGALLVALIYVSISVIPMLLIPQPVLAASNAPFADLFAQLLGSGSGRWLAAFVIISGLGALNGWTLMVGEVTQNFARHGSFPPALGKVNAHGAPTRAFVLTGVVASLMLLMNYNESMAGGFTFLSVVVTAGNLPLYFGCALAAIVLWRRGQGLRPGKRELLWFFAAVVGAIYCIWAFVGIGARSLLWAAVLGAAGIPVHLWYVRRRAADNLERVVEPGQSPHPPDTGATLTLEIAARGRRDASP